MSEVADSWVCFDIKPLKIKLSGLVRFSGWALQHFLSENSWRHQWGMKWEMVMCWNSSWWGVFIPKTMQDRRVTAKISAAGRPSNCWVIVNDRHLYQPPTDSVYQSFESCTQETALFSFSVEYSHWTNIAACTRKKETTLFFKNCNSGTKKEAFQWLVNKPTMQCIIFNSRENVTNAVTLVKDNAKCLKDLLELYSLGNWFWNIKTLLAHS